MTRRPPITILAALACLAGLVVVGFAALVVRAGHVRDAAMLHGFTGLDRPSVHDDVYAIAHFADPMPYALAGLACIAVALARRRGWRALAIVVLLLVTGATTQVLKHALAEPRVVAWLHNDQIGTTSWPSGHSTAAMTLALCAVIAAPPALRALAALAGGAFAIGVGYAVLVLHWHYPSDVLGGYLVAGLWGSLALAWVHQREAGAPEAAARASWEAVVRLAGAGIVVAAAIASARSHTVSLYAAERPTLVIGALGIAALALALVATLSAASGPGARRAR